VKIMMGCLNPFMLLIIPSGGANKNKAYSVDRAHAKFRSLSSFTG